MGSTKRLYQADSYATEFEATVTGLKRVEEGYAVTLDATLFYPETGGQPCDTGLIAGTKVQRVVEEGEELSHITAATPTVKAGERAKGVIDWPRRFLNMQQHTGQHILSQAFARALDAPTISSRLGLDHSTVDVARLDLTWDEMEGAERLANSIVFEDRPVLVREARPEDAGAVRAKKTLADGSLRLVEVEGFDVVPCGGTHCRRAGEVGLVKILGWEKVRENTRVGFVCGGLAEADYFWKSRALAELAQEFTTGVTQVPQLVRELAEGARTLRKELARLRTRLAERELADWESRARLVSGTRIITALLDDVAPPDLRQMAAKLTSGPKTVALLGSRGERAHFVFSRSSDVPADMRKALGAAMELAEGKGGGRAECAEGGGKNPAKLEEGLRAAGAVVESMLREPR